MTATMKFKTLDVNGSLKDEEETIWLAVTISTHMQQIKKMTKNNFRGRHTPQNSGPWGCINAYLTFDALAHVRLVLM